VSKDDAGAKPAGNTKPAATPKAAPKAAPAPKAALPAAKQTITKTAMATTTVRAK
jgi:hypothetical protein